MTPCARLASSAVIALLAVSPVHAERRVEDASDSVRNDSWWSEIESGGTSPAKRGKCTIEESSGKVRITSLQGRGGSAAYRSRWLLDWTDGFTAGFDLELACGAPARNSQSATSGVALGFGAFDPSKGFSDGVNVQARRTRSGGARLELHVRRNGNVTSAASAPLPPGAVPIRLSWTSVGGSVGLQVMVGSSPTPVLAADGLQSRFGARRDEGMGLAMFGSSAGGFRFESSFDNLQVSGDDFDDSDDAEFDDDDGEHDDDEDGIEGNDDHENDGDDDDDDNDDGDGDDDGDDDDDDHASSTLPSAEFASAVAAGQFSVLEAETERVAGVLLVELLEWDAAGGLMVRQRVDPATGQVVLTQSWAPTASQLAKWQAEIDALPTLGVTLQDALAQVGASQPGARIEEAELDVRPTGPVWEIEFVTSAGVERELRIPAG